MVLVQNASEEIVSPDVSLEVVGSWGDRKVAPVGRVTVWP